MPQDPQASKTQGMQENCGTEDVDMGGSGSAYIEKGEEVGLEVVRIIGGNGLGWRQLVPFGNERRGGIQDEGRSEGRLVKQGRKREHSMEGRRGLGGEGSV